MFSKHKIKATYIVIALIGLIVLWYLSKPKTNFDACYDKCIKAMKNLNVEEYKKPLSCIQICSNTK